jgi:hypothetical protein
MPFHELTNRELITQLNSFSPQQGIQHGALWFSHKTLRTNLFFLLGLNRAQVPPLIDTLSAGAFMAMVILRAIVGTGPSNKKHQLTEQPLDSRLTFDMASIGSIMEDRIRSLSVPPLSINVCSDDAEADDLESANLRQDLSVNSANTLQLP